LHLIMTLPYKVVKVSALNDSSFDGLLYVSNDEAKHPEPFQTVLKAAAELDNEVNSSVGVYPLSSGPKRLIYAPTGTIDPDYYDGVNRFAVAAKKGTTRALKAGVKRPLIALTSHKGFETAPLVTLLGVMEALYDGVQYREAHPSKCPRVKEIGVWTDNPDTIDKLISLAVALESGRIVARDVGGPDPERMAPPRVEEYIRANFPADSGIKIDVITDEKVFDKEYPLFAAVNRAASVIERHRGRIMYLTYEGSNPTKTLFLVGKGVTYDTGGADLKVGGVMAGMSRDKCGAAAVGGFMKTLSLLKPPHLRVVGAMSMVRNSIGENAYVSDEVIMARSGKRVRIGNTDAEGRMIMADVLCRMKELAVNAVDPHIMTIATLTGHAALTVGPGYTISMDNGVARKTGASQALQKAGDEVGDLVEISTIRREDFEAYKGKTDEEDLVQANTQPSSRSRRGHQGPAAFLIMASGLDKHGVLSKQPMAYSHLDIAGSSGDVPDQATGAPLLALASRFIGLSV